MRCIGSYFLADQTQAYTDAPDVHIYGQDGFLTAKKQDTCRRFGANSP